MKSSKLSIDDRAERREEIMFKRNQTRSAHRRVGRSYLKYTCTAFPNRRDLRSAARRMGVLKQLNIKPETRITEIIDLALIAGKEIPIGPMHSLPAGHYVNSNDYKRAAAFTAQITSETVAIEPKRSRAKKAAAE